MKYTINLRAKERKKKIYDICQKNDNMIIGNMKLR